MYFQLGSSLRHTNSMIVAVVISISMKAVRRESKQERGKDSGANPIHVHERRVTCKEQSGTCSRCIASEFKSDKENEKSSETCHSLSFPPTTCQSVKKKSGFFMSALLRLMIMRSVFMLWPLDCVSRRQLLSSRHALPIHEIATTRH